jgi:hypothetical protein
MPGRLLQRDSPLTPPATISPVDKLSPTLSDTGSVVPDRSKVRQVCVKRSFHQRVRPRAGWKRSLDQAVVSRSSAWVFDPGIGHAKLVCDDAVECGRSSRLRTAEVDLILFLAGTPGEVACHGAQAALPRCRRLPHAETAIAAGLVQPGTRLDKLRQTTFSDQLFEGLT